MTYNVRAVARFEKALRRLPAPDGDRIIDAIGRLRNDPFRVRAGADVRRLAGSHPPKLRLWVGPWRIVYMVDGRTIVLVDLFKRQRGYRE